jgi:putative NADH-flavin reductase
MKLLILGASGGTGLEIVRQALTRGDAVTALVRSPEKLHAFGGSIRVEKGSPLSDPELERVLPGHDAVLSAFGPRVPVAKTDNNLLREFATVLTRVMVRVGVRRAIVESTAFLFKDSLMPPTYLVGRLLFPSVVADATAMEHIFAQSGLDWTMLRPPKLTDDAHTGQYRTCEGRLPRFGFSISRANVADWFLNTLDDPSTIRKVLGASN